MSNPVPIFDDYWPEDGDRPVQGAPGPARMAQDDVLYDELNTPLDYYQKTFTASEDLPLDFMDQAAVQCRLAKARARHWIEVREARKENGAFQIVLPFLPGSAQKLLNEHVPVRHRQLLAIVAGTVAGLVEIQRLLKRPHGNLKLTNVLFRSRKLTADAVALTDPAPTMRAIERGEAGDLRKLGEMIHLLVLHRLPRGEGDWPVAPSREWENVGRQGDRWRDLCSRLIDPRGPSVSLETTGRFLRKITARGRMARRAVVIAMAVATVLGGIGVYQRFAPPTRPTEVAVVTPRPNPITPAVPVVKPPVPKQETRPQETKPPETTIKPVVKPPAPPAPPPIDPAVAQALANSTLARVKGLASIAMLKTGEMRVRWAEDRHRREIALFIDDCSRPVVTSLPEVGKAIEAENHRIVEIVNRDPTKFGPAIVAERERMASRLLLVDRMLKGLPKGTSIKAGTPPGERISEVLSKGVESRRVATVRKGIAMAGQAEVPDQRLDAALKEMIGNTIEVHTDGAKLVAEVDQVTRMLAAGFMPDAAVDGKPMRNVVAAWSSTASYADPEIRRAIEPLMGAVTQTDPVALKQTAISREELLGLRLAAWHSNDYPAPRSASELQTEMTTRDGLLHTAEVLKESPRYQVVTQQIAADFALRWEYFMSHAASGKDIAYALGAEVRPASLDVTKLPAAARWNAEWLELNTVMANHDPAVLPRVHELVTDLVATGEKLPAGTVKAELLKGLRDWNDQQGGEDLTHIGPASVAGWSAEPDATGMLVMFHTPTNAEPLIFRRVAMPTGDVFVCTTEMSMGVFSDVITAANRWREVRDTKLLGDPSVTGAVGPRAWQWSPRRDAGIVRSLVWLSSEWVPAGADDYPEALGGEFNRATLRPLHGESAEAMSPSRRQPMQQVSADAAQYVANLAGCRLPTPQEWKAAYASSSQQMRGANLRDKSWRLELQHMTRAWPRNNGTYRPDAGMFLPAGEALSDDVWMSAAKEEYDDGTLWFREVSPAGGDAREFLNLAGNVGEFVRDALGKVSVIGGSALSPPTRAVDKEFEVASADRRRGFSDVGFRLAFSAPAKPMERLGGILPGRDEGFVMARK